jgi:hypothetical protein
MESKRKQKAGRYFEAGGLLSAVLMLPQRSKVVL